MVLPIKVLKPVAFLLCLAPLSLLVGTIAIAPDSLPPSFTANPQAAVTDWSGDWTLRFVLLTLAVSPLRQLAGWNSLIRFRRMIGLYAFFYSLLHFLTYVWFTQGFDYGAIVEDVVKRLFITVGFVAFVLMIPLAITSTKKWISRLGGKRWIRLHQAVYLTGILGVIHFIWRVKSDIREPLLYAAVLTLLLGYRLWNKFRTTAVVR